MNAHLGPARVAEEEVAPAFAWRRMLPEITDQISEEALAAVRVALAATGKVSEQSGHVGLSVFFFVLGSHPSCWSKEMLHRVTRGGGPLQQISSTLLVRGIPICN